MLQKLSKKGNVNDLTFWIWIHLTAQSPFQRNRDGQFPLLHQYLRLLIFPQITCSNFSFSWSNESSQTYTCTVSSFLWFKQCFNSSANFTGVTSVEVSFFLTSVCGLLTQIIHSQKLCQDEWHASQLAAVSVTVPNPSIIIWCLFPWKFQISECVCFSDC